MNQFGWPRLALLFSFLLITYVPSHAMLQGTEESQQEQNAPTNVRIDRLRIALSKKVERSQTQNELPGMIAGFQQRGSELVVASSGVRQIGSDQLFTTDDLVHIGSCTKAMTTLVIARLVDRGKLQWDMTVGDGLPELAKRMNPEFQKVTLRQLLMHRGGMSANTRWNKYPNPDDLTAARRKLVLNKLARPPSRTIGDYHYSNLGYVTAALFASSATGKSWEELIQEELFQPLGMKSAGFGVPGTEGETDQPWGHLDIGRLLPIQQDNHPTLGPAGTVHLSISDWAKFAAQQLPPALATKKQPRLVTEQNRIEMHRTLKGAEGEGKNYALGWLKFQQRGQTYLEHSGSNTMWLATVSINLSDGSMYFCASNCTPARSQKAVSNMILTMQEMVEKAQGTKPEDDG